MKLSHLVRAAAVDRREREGVELVVVALDERADQVDVRTVSRFLDDAQERRDRLARQSRDVFVVAEMGPVSFDYRVRLVDVLLADERRDAMSGVLRPIEARDVRICRVEPCRRVHHDAERDREEHQVQRERDGQPPDERGACRRRHRACHSRNGSRRPTRKRRV
ncbi:MAG: hypothetical protein KIT84_11125 [Labilithrix sp.]|nr:hypothetical protein [Labilithrix sp.]MCW5811560.1 hypothetical protein [Labilithrix sp.]